MLGLLCIFLLSPVQCLSIETDQQQPEKKVLILYSHGREIPAHDLVHDGIKNIFDNNNRFTIKIHTQYLDLSRFSDTHYRDALANLLQIKYNDFGIDLIIAVDKPAVDFLEQYSERILPHVNIVFCAVLESYAKHLKHSVLRNHITGVVMPENADEVIKIALALRPSTRRIFIVAGSSETDKYREAVVLKALEKYAGTIEITRLSGLRFQDIATILAQAPSDSVIFFAAFFVDGSGKSFVPREALQQFSAVTKVPIFGISESHLGYGIVGGKLFSYTLQGERAALMGLRILNGESPHSIAFENGENTYVEIYDWREFMRWGLKKDILPPNAILKFYQPSIWDQYQWQIIIIAAIALFQTALIIALASSLRKKRQAEAALLENKKDLQNLTGRLLSSQEEMLRRISREIHDDLTQRLALIAIEAGKLEIKMQSSPHYVGIHEIIEIKKQLIQIANDFHALSRQIHPSILDDLGLVKAMESECNSFSKRSGIVIHFQADNIPDAVPKDAALCLYRILQEGLRNIAKHAHVSHASVKLEYQKNVLTLTIRDEGLGFALPHHPDHHGLGLASMRERIQFVKGDFTVDSEPGVGTTIRASIPLQKEII
jgi:signal transduction histidine kinase